MNRKISFTILTVFLLALLIPLAYADEVKTLNVDAGHEMIFTINLSGGMNVKGSISVTGDSGDDIDFWISDPTGNKISGLGRVSQGTQFEFTANQDGAYSLHFDNSFSLLSTKNVIITYEATIAGMDATQMFILTFLVVVIIVVGIVVILKKGKKKRTRCETPNK